MYIYYAIVVPGLEKVAWSEIQSNFQDIQLIDQGIGRIIFSYQEDPGDLLRLRSVEDIFVFVREISGLTRSRNSLGSIYGIVKGSDFEFASRLHKQAHRGKGRKNLTFKVSSNMKGRHNFRRVDAQKAVELALVAKYGWRLQHEEPLLEVRIDLEEDKAILGLKLSDEKMSNRTYKIFHLPASLKPTVAYCMAILSEPNPNDVFVDPMCGAGTIPIERAYAGAYKAIFAGDLKEAIVHSAKGNVSESKKSIKMAVWDIFNMPLQNRSVDKVVCNLPFGKKIGSRSKNQMLYNVFFKETARILKPGGKAVLLTTEKELLQEIISQYPSMRIRRQLKIDLLGIKAFIYLINLV